MNQTNKMQFAKGIFYNERKVEYKDKQTWENKSFFAKWLAIKPQELIDFVKTLEINDKWFVNLKINYSTNTKKYFITINNFQETETKKKISQDNSEWIDPEILPF